MKVNIIAAVALNGAIGRENGLIWHIAEDMRFFKSCTTGHPIIMGRKTFESIGRPLPGRLNIVISRAKPSLPEGVELAHSLEQALDLAQKHESAPEQVFVIGGGQIYAQAMDLADTLYITRVFCCPTDADTFFPPILADKWDIAEESGTQSDEKSGLEFRFEKWVKL